jgi:hypothetical protein
MVMAIAAAIRVANIAGFALASWLCVSAPEGHQDAAGFHVTHPRSRRGDRATIARCALSHSHQVWRRREAFG